MATQAKTVYRLKVTLRQVKPPVWRRIEVPSNIKLSDLADVPSASPESGPALPRTAAAPGAMATSWRRSATRRTRSTRS